MYVVGLTGGIGSGKSVAGAFFRHLGIEVIDADYAARAVVESGSEALEKIAAHFGTDILQADGTLNRRKLRSIIFECEQERLWLESLLHPLIKQWIQQNINAVKSPYAVLESPLLLETNQHETVNCSVVIDVPEETQVQRYMKRDGGTEEQANAIIAAQMKRQQRIEKADFVVDNTESLESLNKTIIKLHDKFLELSQDDKKTNG